MRGKIFGFKQDGNYGGRLSKSNAVVGLDMELDKQNKSFNISVYDEMSNEDGHYSPVTLTYQQAYYMKTWIEAQLDEVGYKHQSKPHL